MQHTTTRCLGSIHVLSKCRLPFCTIDRNCSIVYLQLCPSPSKMLMYSPFSRVRVIPSPAEKNEIKELTKWLITQKGATGTEKKKQKQNQPAQSCGLLWHFFFIRLYAAENVPPYMCAHRRFSMIGIYSGRISDSQGCKTTKTLVSLHGCSNWF